MRTNPNMRSMLKWCRNNPGLTIPIALIFIISATLLTTVTIRTWPEWIVTSQSPATTLVPDNADVVVTFNIEHLARRKQRNSLYRWMQDNSGHAKAQRDWRNSIADTTGLHVDEQTLQTWRARQAALFAVGSDWGLTIAVRDTDAAASWVTSTETSDDRTWSASLIDAAVVVTSNSDITTMVEHTAASENRTTIANTADYRSARDAHRMTRPIIVVFARWRSLPARLQDQLGGPLDCDPQRWVSANIGWDHEKLEMEIICPRPTRPWTLTTLDEHDPRLIPVNADALLEMTFPANWERLHDRLSVQSQGAASLLSHIAATTTPDDDIDQTLMDTLSGRATLWTDSESGNWRAMVDVSDPQLLRRLSAKIVAAMGAAWGTESVHIDPDTATATVRHPTWPDHPITASWSDAHLMLSTDGATLADVTMTPAEPSEAVMISQWTSQETSNVADRFGEPVADWFAGMGSGKAVGHYETGLYRYELEITWAAAPE